MQSSQRTNTRHRCRKACFLIAVFVVWRAQDFHYCVFSLALASRKAGSAASADVCAPNEQPMRMASVAGRRRSRQDWGPLGTHQSPSAFGLDSVAKKP